MTEIIIQEVKEGIKIFKCTKCLIIKASIEFYINNRFKNNISYHCKECIREKSRRYHFKNKEKSNARSKKYREHNKEYFYVKKKEWYKNNREKCSKIQKRRLENDPLFRFNNRLRTLIRNSFKNNKYSKNINNKPNKTESILGCSIVYFCKYIERKFTEGMSFENHGEWHLDHITPLSSAKNVEDSILLNHYTNFQPLWAADNLKKSNKTNNETFKNDKNE